MFRWIAAGWLCAILAAGTAVTASALTPPAGPDKTALAAYVGPILDLSPTVAAARAEVDAAKARNAGARLWRENPEVEVDFEDAEVQTKTVGISQQIEWFPKPSTRGRASDRRLDAARADLADARQRLLADLLSALVEVDQRRLIEAVAARNAEAMHRLADLSEKFRRAGDISASEEQASHVAASRADIALQSTRVSLSEAEQTLSEIAGMPEAPRLSFNGLPPAPFSTDEIEIDSLPKVTAVRLRQEAADTDVKTAKWNRIPDPTIGLRWGEEGNDNLFGVRVSIPIPVLNSGRAEVDAARADAVSATARLDATRRAVQARLRETARRYTALHASQALWQGKGLVALSEQSALLERRLLAGDIPTIEYLVQLQQLYEVETASLELRGQVWTAWFELLETAGKIEAWVGVER